MIYLNSGTNSIVATLYERCSNIINPYFTWRLIDKDSDATYIFYADDTSRAPYYWNSFTVSVAVGSATAGFVNIPPSTYSYEVYEMTNPYDLNLNNSLGIVENGIITYNATFSRPKSFTQSNDDVTIVYRNQNRI
jgi:hypothetical protein